MRRLLACLMLLMLLPCFVLGEETEADLPLTLRDATSAEEVEQFLLMPSKYNLAGVQRGYIRYIGQNQERDDAFRTGYWLGGEEGTALDLTRKTRWSGEPYTFYAGNMCSRAVYSMALSYLGIDMTPGDMSRMMNSRNLDEPYDIISWKVGVERVPASADAFNTMMANYMSDDSYSPVYLYFRKPNGSTHAVLVVATIPEKSRYLVVDVNPPQSGGKLYRVYFISLNKKRDQIVNSTFYELLKGSSVLQLHQWRLIETPVAEE